MTPSPPQVAARPEAPAAARPGYARPRRWLEGLLVITALLLGLYARCWMTQGFLFAGADSYSYTSAAAELRQHHRYGFRLPPWYPTRPSAPPPGRCRPPGYPLLLAALGTQDEKDYPPFFERTKHVQWFLDIGAALCVYLLGRTLAGRLVAALALAAYLLHPTMMAYSGSIMTETTAVAFSALALWLCAVACEPRRSLRAATRALCGAGVAVALGMLVRADGVLLGPCLLLPLVLRREPLRARGRMVALTLLCALVTYSPWVLRNLHTFGAPYAFGSLCEIDGTPIERTWFHHWYASWVRTEHDLLSTQGCIYRRTCATSMIMFPEYAFDSDAERLRVYQLLWQHSREGMSASIDDGFHELWRQKVLRHPLRTLVLAPAHRARHLWLGANDLPTRARPPEQPTRLPREHRLYGRLAQVSAWLALSGLFSLLLPVWRARRNILGLSLLAIGVRTGFLALLGFPEPRYILELLPLTLVLGGIALATPLRLALLAHAGSRTDRR